MTGTELRSNPITGDEARERLLAGLPVSERRLRLNGVLTAVLEGGGGPPVVLLHGPGEYGAKWLRVIPDLVVTHRVVAPDLPGHGASRADGKLDAERLIGWLDDLMEQFGMAPIPDEELARITVPTSLIWGRHDLATRLPVAQAVAARHGWPLHVIENAADDPPMEQPEAFLAALRAALLARKG